MAVFSLTTLRCSVCGFIWCVNTGIVQGTVLICLKCEVERLKKKLAKAQGGP